MSRPSLLNIDDTGFVFEHAMAHRNALGVMSPLNRFSVIPYFIDPMPSVAPMQTWRLNHQQAHNDALNQLPSQYLGPVVAGSGVGSNLIDSDLSVAWNKSWWTFFNHIEHYVGSNMILPAQQPPPPPAPVSPGWVYPFW